jgi:pimeloyl-ACP methyl ester carboxylesterase
MTSQGFVSVPGGRLYAEAAGDPSNPALLFIHAGIADCTMWEPQVEFFAPNYRVIRFDTRGFGRTRTEDIEFSNRADVAAVLDHFGADQAAVIGCSRGGQIALDFTLEFPHRVCALVPVCAGVSGFPHEPTGSAQEKIEEQLFEAMEAAENAGDWERVADLDVQMWVDGTGQPTGRADVRVREAVRRMCLSNYTAAGPGGKAIPLDPPAAGRLAKINVPALVMIGDLDTSGAQRMAEAMATGIRGAEKRVFAGAAHLPSMEQPDAFNQTLRDFLVRRAL